MYRFSKLRIKGVWSPTPTPCHILIELMEQNLLTTELGFPRTPPQFLAMTVRAGCPGRKAATGEVEKAVRVGKKTSTRAGGKRWVRWIKNVRPGELRDGAEKVALPGILHGHEALSVLQG